MPALLALAVPATALGATINVNSKGDQLGGGKCSLRNAVEAANNDAKSGGCPKGSGADKILIPAGNYKLKIAGTGEDANVDGDLDITAPATIIGAGPGKTTVDGNGEKTGERAFNLPDGDKATFQNLTIRNGLDETNEGGGAVFSDYGTRPMTLKRVRILANVGSGYGGGVSIWGTGKLTIANSVIADNDGDDGYGGGVYSYNNEVEITNTKIDGNTGDDSGGGVYLEDPESALIKNAKIRGNSVTGGGYGGGMYVYDAVDEIRIERSTISSNSINYDSSGYYGGGMYVYESDVIVSDSTVNGNFAVGSGGGMYQDGGTLRVLYSTLSHNSVNDDGGAIHQNNGNLIVKNSTISRNNAYGYAGGIYVDNAATLNNVTIYRNQSYNESYGIGLYENGGASAEFSNSIIAKNRYEGGSTFYDCYGGTSAGNNLVSDGVDCNTTGDDIVGDSSERVDPRLGELRDNGGRTFTHALEAGSPALGEGGPGCESKDQRRKSRAGACDIGAFER